MVPELCCRLGMEQEFPGLAVPVTPLQSGALHSEMLLVCSNKGGIA